MAPILDVVRVLGAGLWGAARAGLRRLAGGSVRPSWTFRHEVMVGLYKGTWSLMPVLGVVRWRVVGDTLSPALSAGLPTTPFEAPGLAGEWFEPPDADGTVVIYLHGGGFVFGSLRTHGDLVGAIAIASSARTLGLSYRLAPEHPAPAAIEDTCAAYRAVLRMGVPAERVVLAGDSAGGNLVLTALLALRDAGDPLPAAGVCISPWTDLSNSGDSFATSRALDFVGLEHCALAAGHVLAGADARRPDLSPLYADPTGLPPLLIQFGEVETLADQIRAFADRATAAGVQVELEQAPDMVHVWHLMRGIIPEAQEAIDGIGRFVRAHTGARGARQDPPPSR